MHSGILPLLSYTCLTIALKHLKRPPAFRYHNVGILVLFLHDINDIQLEFTKLNIYLKSRGGGYHLLNDVLSNMGSVSFSITWSVSAKYCICSLLLSHQFWTVNSELTKVNAHQLCFLSFTSLRFWFRLYWFPLKVLYATCVSSIQSVPTIPFYFFFNALLFALLLMNIYWFLVRTAQIVCLGSVCPTLQLSFALFRRCCAQFIVIFVVKVLKVKEVNDVREYEEEEDSKAAAGLLSDSQGANKDDDAGHHIAAQG